MNPLFFMIPVTVTCSYAFMLPAASPCNAIAFSAAKMNNPREMIKAGLLMNVICVLVITGLTITYGNFLFNFQKFPTWANNINNNVTSSSSGH